MINPGRVFTSNERSSLDECRKIKKKAAIYTLGAVSFIFFPLFVQSYFIVTTFNAGFISLLQVFYSLFFYFPDGWISV